MIFLFRFFYTDVQRVACNSHNRHIWKITNERIAVRNRMCAKFVIKGLPGMQRFGIIGEYIRARNRINATLADRHLARRHIWRITRRCIRARNHLSVIYVRPRLPIVSHWSDIGKFTRNMVSTLVEIYMRFALELHCILFSVEFWWLSSKFHVFL